MPGSPGGPFEVRIPMLALAATAPNGGPVENHAAQGACLEFRVVSLAGPLAGTNRLQRLTDPTAAPRQGFYRLRDDTAGGGGSPPWVG
jgi:hypothetical protein